MTALPLDVGPVEQLSKEIMLCVVGHYVRRPMSRATAQEVLNALAIAAAYVLAGASEADDGDGARSFFDQALQQQLQALDG